MLNGGRWGTSSPLRMKARAPRHADQCAEHGARTWRCARLDMMDVGMLVASDVPTVTCMRTDSSVPSSVKMW